MAAEVVTMISAPTVNGEELTIRVDEQVVFVNEAQVVAADIKASNGVIHIVDTVMLPD